MLAVTPDSFVFLDGKGGVRVNPALLCAKGSLALSQAEPWSLGRFFAGPLLIVHRRSQVGVTSREAFRETLDALPPNEILVVTARAATDVEA
jgi:hypothetical protein